MKNQNDKVVTVLSIKNPALQLSQILNHLMVECSIDGVQLSKKTGIPVTTINRLRKCDPNNNPTLTTLVPLAEFFAVTVSQLIGDEPLPNSRIKGTYRIKNETLHHIPLLSWEESLTWPDMANKPNATIATEHEYSKNAYALSVEEDDWENLIKGTVLLIDPKLEPRSRDYIIVHKKGQKIPTLKQALYDEDQMYLKPLISGYNIAMFTPEHKILGVVVEFKKNMRKIFHPNNQQQEKKSS